MNQGVFKEVGRVWWYSSLIDEFSLNQPSQLVLEHRLIELGNGLEEFIRKLATDDRSVLGYGFRGNQTVQPRHQ